MASNPLNDALTQLGSTINSITGKVEENKKRVKDYKTQVIAKLGQVVQQLTELKNSSGLRSIPQLKQQLQQTQTELQTKTSELESTKTELANATRNLQDLQNKLQDLNRQIQDKNTQIEQLTNNKQQLNQQVEQLNQQLQQLNKDKVAAEQNLAAAQQQIDSLVQRIGQINTTLGGQIQLIDSIVNEMGSLDNNGDEVALQFQAVSDNIMAIMNMINNPSSASAQYDVESNYSNLMALHGLTDKRQYSTFVRGLDGALQNQINQNINNAERGDTNAISSIKTALQSSQAKVPRPTTSGGKKRKTMKKRVFKGGYTYSASKSLDKSSSIITSKSGTTVTSGKKRRTKKSKRSSVSRKSSSSSL